MGQQPLLVQPWHDPECPIFDGRAGNGNPVGDLRLAAQSQLGVGILGMSVVDRVKAILMPSKRLAFGRRLDNGLIPG